MFWGCFSYKGPGCLIPIDGMMNSDRYIHLIETRITRELESQQNPIFQHDLAPCHTSRKTKSCLEENGICVLDWPGNSPDVSPIENLWHICKARLRKKDCSSKQKMIAALIWVWFHDEEISSICEKLINSMPNRVSALLKAKGGHIMYWSICAFHVLQINTCYSWIHMILSTVGVCSH